MSETVDLRQLLAIDIEAELRKLATAQLQGPWQLPAELVRRSLSAGARTVEVELGRASVRVRDDGAAIGRELLLALADLLDTGVQAERRHRALLALEQAGALALLALPALRPGRVEIVARSHGLVRRLECAGPGRANLSEGADPSGGRGTEFVVRGAELDPARARTYLADVARFAPAAVRVDGSDISDGLRSYLARADLELPQFKLRGTVALAHRGEPARIWLLVHGVVSTHVGVTRAPCFEAVVELADKFAAGELTPAATAADLREAIAPALEAIVDAGVQLMLATGARSASLPGTSQARVLHLLLQALRSRRRAAEVLALPVVPALVSRDERRWLAIESLPALARPEPAFALEPEQNPDDFALPGPPILLLGTAERGILAELLQLRFRSPPPRGTEQMPVSAALTRGWRQLAQAFGGARRPLPDSALSPAERQFLATLRAAVRGGAGAPERVELCAGAGSPRVAGEPATLYLGREHPDVRAAIAAAETGEAWIFPACIALLAGSGMPGTASRATWVRTWHRLLQGR
ncbi:hypothetical protein OV090_48385 [Nannocystis sp. RBIL2]|uniref:hypothetical protein n=1 Tax=Nannocystis sp. RBIL2 TaxID=2996788 RepID=UPI002270892F|nr:hypothetical protein [Nannocystis sp. RBIL2]MCY1072658.1 hypothetical protein [Nannocystis sp. RBIL2]